LEPQKKLTREKKSRDKLERKARWKGTKLTRSALYTWPKKEDANKSTNKEGKNSVETDSILVPIHQRPSEERQAGSPGRRRMGNTSCRHTGKNNGIKRLRENSQKA